MSAPTSRNRLVVFRLTQDEYDSLKEACSERGGRNLSEFTRTELMAILRSDSIDGFLEKRFSEVECRLRALQGSVEEIAVRLGRLTGSQEELS